ncbi:MAG: histidine phosphatase family protein [Lachnospiraceae bacterium]|nr:histidine phosphatase family protein [Lachnospiraceae bacterium]
MARKIVYLIRHGRTPGNAEKKYIGNGIDEPLCDEGRQEAEELRKRMEAQMPDRPDRICASPLKRAVETADILYDTNDIRLIDKLTEIDFGAFEGKNHMELNGDPAYQAWIDEGGKGKIPGGEDFNAFCRRSYTGFQKALGEPDRKETIHIVCHGGTIMAVMSELTGKEYFTFMTENLGGYRLELEYGDAGTFLISYDCLWSWNRP